MPKSSVGVALGELTEKAKQRRKPENMSAQVFSALVQLYIGPLEDGALGLVDALEDIHSTCVNPRDITIANVCVLAVSQE